MTASVPDEGVMAAAGPDGPATLEELVDEVVARLFAIGLDINLAMPYLSGLIAERLSAARADTERLVRLLREDVVRVAAGNGPLDPAPSAPAAEQQAGFFALARHEVRVAERDGTPLELLYLVVDPHDTADAAALDVLADVILLGCRTSDVVTRWSEAAFVVLMRRTSSTEACEVARRLQEAYAARQGEGQVSLRVGVVRRQAGEGLEALVSRAEEQAARQPRG